MASSNGLPRTKVDADEFLGSVVDVNCLALLAYIKEAAERGETSFLSVGEAASPAVNRFLNEDPLRSLLLIDYLVRLWSDGELELSLLPSSGLGAPVKVEIEFGVEPETPIEVRIAS